MNKNTNAVEHLKSAKQIVLQEIGSISVVGRSLTPKEQKRLQALEAATSNIDSASAHLEEERTMNTLITYKIVSDKEGKLKGAARLACNFWNQFILANSSIVIRLGIFTSFGSTIARAYQPYKKNGIVYGQVEFNTKYLMRFTETEIVGTIIHEIGHTLGFGWDKWMQLFDQNTGKFYQQYVNRLPALADMRVQGNRELLTGNRDGVWWGIEPTTNADRQLAGDSDPMIGRGNRTVNKLCPQPARLTCCPLPVPCSLSRRELKLTMDQVRPWLIGMRNNLTRN